MRYLDPDIAGVEREGIAAFDVVPLEGHQEELRHRGIAIVGIEYIDVLGPSPASSYILLAGAFVLGGLFKIKPATDRQVGHRSLRNRRYRA